MATAVTASTPSRTNWNDIGKVILRCTVAGLILFHGIAKARNGIGWMAGPLQSHHLPVFVGYGVYVAEIVAPVLIIAGIFTRLAALVIVFDMIMAMVLVAGSRFFTISMGGGWGVELEMFYLLAALAVFFLGAGRYAFTRGAGRWD